VSLKHPWVNDVFGIKVGYSNRLLVTKWGMCRSYLAERNLEGYLMVVVERPWRLSTLQRWWDRDKIALDELRDLLPVLWMDTEMPSQNLWQPESLWLDAGFVTDDDETWSKLPKKIEVWRGGPHGGISWTLDREVADRFASRFYHEPMLWRAGVEKASALGYLGGRGEHEVILDPELVRWRRAGE
jgi:hypothetical protein